MSPEDPKPQPATTEQGAGHYLFLSYARPDSAVADRVEACLTAAGVRVFRDLHDIRPGENWDQKIEIALDECPRMVLLLSSSSMPYRKEVHREWFYFDQLNKPIYPLFIEDCHLNSRMMAYNYIDVREDLPGAVARIVADLDHDFELPLPMSDADKISVFEKGDFDERDVEQALRDMEKAVLEPRGGVVLSQEQAMAVRDHKPVDLKQYRLGRIAEWSLPRHQINKRFVNLTLILDKGENEPQRWQREDYRFSDLRDVLEKTKEDPALVLLGAPGSGKSTLLRRLQLDHSIERLHDGGPQVSFFIQLNTFKGDQVEPAKWLCERWKESYPQLPTLESYLLNGRVLLLLDALNEMPHKSPDDYRRLVGQWRDFAQEVCRKGNRIVFSCRSLDYSASLSSKEMRVPQVEIQPMNADQVLDFLRAYLPGRHERVWAEIDGEKESGFYRTPYFLKLLCEQVESTGEVPKGRAGLFTGYVRQSLGREINGDQFGSSRLLDERDRQKQARGMWRDAFELPERGILFPRLSDLAFKMQQKGLETEGAQVRIDHDDACALISGEDAETVLKAGVALNVLDEDLTRYEIAFFHQLLQEYFAARRLAKEPNPQLVHVEYAADRVRPPLAETLMGLADGDPLPPLAQTGWEETTMTAAPMARDAESFVRDLMPHNLPLAARCAASPEMSVGENLKREIREGLIARTRDMSVDLRARIAAGEALGIIGDPRFELRQGPYGEYLMPQLVEIPAGTYPIGDNDSSYDDEKPAHTVDLPAFRIGMFPVTNAEYAKFMAADGYKDERWWDTEEAKVWRRGESSTEGGKQVWRDNKKQFESWTEEFIRDLVKQNRITSKQAEDWITIRNWSDERFEQQLDEWYPSGKIYDRPEFWDDERFNNPAQPVVGVTWFEARAYCNWLTANVGEEGPGIFRLPTEVEFEAAARGKEGRLFPYGNEFEVARCNTFESHIRRSTPVGIFDNATPEGAYDLSGNVYTWTLSIYDQDKFPYKYEKNDGRENIEATGVRRVLRGGSWVNVHDFARAVFRGVNVPDSRGYNIGFRVVCFVRPPFL